MLVLLNTRLHSVHFMLALQLAWLCKVYQKPEIFFAFRALHVGSLTLLASQSLVQTRNPFLHIVQSMVGLWLAWWCFNNVCIKFHGSHVKSPTCLTLQSNLGILPYSPLLFLHHDLGSFSFPISFFAFITLVRFSLMI